MPKYDVSCFNRTSGRLVWSQTQEAISPAWAIAQATLPEYRRTVWALGALLDGVDMTPGGTELTITHPVDGNGDFDVAAERIDQ